MSTEHVHGNSLNGLPSTEEEPPAIAQRYCELSSTGDVVLVLQDNTRLRVQTAILRIASPTFQAMFGPHFSEGQNLSCEHPKELPLPDDDPRAMKILCCILHHCYDVTKTPRIADLSSLAVTVDKYLCKSAVQSCYIVWLNSALAQADVLDFRQLVELLAIAYSLKLPDEFYKISSKMVFRYESESRFDFDDSMECLPWKCIVSIVAYKNKCEHELAEEIQGVLDDFIHRSGKKRPKPQDMKAEEICTFGPDCSREKAEKLWDQRLLPCFGASLETYLQMMTSRPLAGEESYKERLASVLGTGRSLCMKCLTFMETERKRFSTGFEAMWREGLVFVSSV
ncbi:hypothetical protein IWZ01DRAFT_234081 [Phyllosticta capitalensis]